MARLADSRLSGLEKTSGEIGHDPLIVPLTGVDLDMTCYWPE